SGYPSNEQLIERYSASSDRDLSHLGWYVALANYKLAGVMEGIHYRYVQGKTVGSGFGDAGSGVEMLRGHGMAARARCPRPLLGSLRRSPERYSAPSWGDTNQARGWGHVVKRGSERRRYVSVRAR